MAPLSNQDNQDLSEWRQVSYYVMAELKRMDRRQEDLHRQLNEMVLDLTTIKTKAMMIGGGASLLLTLAIAVVSWIFGKLTIGIAPP